MTDRSTETEFLLPTGPRRSVDAAHRRFAGTAAPATPSSTPPCD